MRAEQASRSEGRPIERFADHPSPASTWAGTLDCRGGKGYVDAPMGQLHYRDVGPHTGLPALLLLHQCPQSMIEFAAVQNSLSGRGLRSIAIDLPGYGMSDHPKFLPTIGGFADNLLALADRLALDRVVVAGHHTGAAIATALAARSPSWVAGAMLHGLPLYTEDHAASVRDKVLWDCTPVRDGSHVSQLFKWSRRGDHGELVNLTWMSVGMLLQSRDIGHWAVNRYDLARDLMSVRVPGIIISEVDDLTHEMDRRAHALRPDFAFTEISEPGNAMIMARPDEWADIARKFLETLV